MTKSLYHQRHVSEYAPPREYIALTSPAANRLADRGFADPTDADVYQEMTDRELATAWRWLQRWRRLSTETMRNQQCSSPLCASELLDYDWQSRADRLFGQEARRRIRAARYPSKRRIYGSEVDAWAYRASQPMAADRLRRQMLQEARS